MIFRQIKDLPPRTQRISQKSLIRDFDLLLKEEIFSEITEEKRCSQIRINA